MGKHWRKTIHTQALLTAHDPAAFVDFLKNFKSSSTEAAEQLQSLNLGGNDNGDEYDMDDDDSNDAAADGSQTRNKSKLKYMNLLQDVANRIRSDILIDLNDVEAVSNKKILATAQS